MKEQAMDYKELLAHGIAPKDFVHAEFAEVKTEIKAFENRLLNRISAGTILIIAAVIGGYFV